MSTKVQLKDMNAQRAWPSVHQWSSRELTQYVGRVLVLSVVAYVLIRLPEVGIAGLSGEVATYWFGKLLLDVLVLGYVVVRSRWTGLKLFSALVEVYAGLQVVSFVEIYLYGMIPWSDVLSGAVGSLFQGSAIVLLVIVGFGKFRGEESSLADTRLQFPPSEWAWKMIVLAVAFLVLMILAGLVVFEGIAHAIDPQALAGYEIIEPPAWILPFQLVRGVVFTALLLPVVYLFDGGTRERMFAIAVLFATLLASNMITGYDAVPGLLWVAHFFELFSQAFVYGLLAVWLLSRRHRPIQAVQRRLGLHNAASEITD